VAVDAVGAGVGDVVLVATGSAVRELDGLAGVAADAAIVAIVDPG
jgi:microcompartment protein CcmK/EutM